MNYYHYGPIREDPTWAVKNVDKLECIKSVWHNETLIPQLSDKTIDRSSDSFQKMIKRLHGEEVTKWVVKHLELKKEDFLDAFANKDEDDGSRRGVFKHHKMTVKCAEFLQSKFKFSMYEALGSNLGTLSGHGEGGRTDLVKWIVKTFNITKSLFEEAGWLFKFETIKLAADCCHEDTCTFLADHFEMSREDLVDYVLDSCAQGGYMMLYWLHKRVQLRRMDVMMSTIDSCVTCDRRGSLRFFRNVLGIRCAQTTNDDVYW